MDLEREQVEPAESLRFATGPDLWSDGIRSVRRRSPSLRRRGREFGSPSVRHMGLGWQHLVATYTDSVSADLLRAEHGHRSRTAYPWRVAGRRQREYNNVALDVDLDRNYLAPTELHITCSRSRSVLSRLRSRLRRCSPRRVCFRGVAGIDRHLDLGRQQLDPEVNRTCRRTMPHGLRPGQARTRRVRRGK